MGNYDFALDLESINTMSVINKWIEPKSEVLEFGSANGRLTKYLSEEKECNVTIVEIDEKSGNDAAKYAKKSYIGLEFGNIQNYYWETEKECYQYIIFADVLEHLSNPKEVLYKCKGMLKEGGRILISIPNITHNSVLIDMMNDKFEYHATGLLDNTHIHFFTHKTFAQMARECELFICETVPIYSRVGNNEIHNTFHDVPIEVAQYLRKRVSGSVYQYVFNLSKCEHDIQNEKNIIKELEIEKYEQLETLCFYKEKEDILFLNEKRVGQCYFENEQVCFEVDLEDIDENLFLRWMPMLYNGIVQIKQCQIIDGEQSYELKIKNSNISSKAGNLFIFKEDMPWIEFEKIPEEYVKGKLYILFTVFVYRKGTDFFEKVTGILSEMEKGVSGLELDHNKIISELQAENKERKVYSEHLEQDIKDQKEYVEHLEKDIKEQKEYIEHLEKDIKEQKEYIIYLEKDSEERKCFTEHLEKDIVEQKNYIRHLEKDIQELNEFIKQKNR